MPHFFTAPKLALTFFDSFPSPSLSSAPPCAAAATAAAADFFFFVAAPPPPAFDAVALVGVAEWSLSLLWKPALTGVGAWLAGVVDPGVPAPSPAPLALALYEMDDRLKTRFTSVRPVLRRWAAAPVVPLM